MYQKCFKKPYLLHHTSANNVMKTKTWLLVVVFFVATAKANEIYHNEESEVYDHGQPVCLFDGHLTTVCPAAPFQLVQPFASEGYDSVSIPDPISRRFLTFDEWRAHNSEVNFRPRPLFSSRQRRRRGHSEGRLNHVSLECGAKILKTNKEAEGISNVQVENSDRYLLNKCSARDKFIVFELCEEILVDTFVIANFELFSSTFKDLRISVSPVFPPKEWTVLGSFRANNTGAVQVFALDNPILWARYLRIEVLSHHGNEYFCPISIIRVHGITMMEDYRDEMEELLDNANNIQQENEEEEEKRRKEEKPSLPPPSFPSDQLDSSKPILAVMSDWLWDMANSVIFQNTATEHSETLSPSDLAPPHVQHELLPLVFALDANDESTDNDFKAGNDRERTSSALPSSSPCVEPQPTPTIDPPDMRSTPPSLSPSPSPSPYKSRGSTFDEPPQDIERDDSTVYQKEEGEFTRSTQQEPLLTILLRRLSTLQANVTDSARYLEDQIKLVANALNELEQEMTMRILRSNQNISQLVMSVQKETSHLRKHTEEQLRRSFAELAEKHVALQRQINLMLMIFAICIVMIVAIKLKSVFWTWMISFQTDVMSSPTTDMASSPRERSNTAPSLLINLSEIDRTVQGPSSAPAEVFDLEKSRKATRSRKPRRSNRKTVSVDGLGPMNMLLTPPLDGLDDGRNGHFYWPNHERSKRNNDGFLD